MPSVSLQAMYINKGITTGNTSELKLDPENPKPNMCCRQEIPKD